MKNIKNFKTFPKTVAAVVSTSFILTGCALTNGNNIYLAEVDGNVTIVEKYKGEFAEKDSREHEHYKDIETNEKYGSKDCTEYHLKVDSDSLVKLTDILTDEEIQELRKNVEKRQNFLQNYKYKEEKSYPVQNLVLIDTSYLNPKTSTEEIPKYYIAVFEQQEINEQEGRTIIKSQYKTLGLSQNISFELEMNLADETKETGTYTNSYKIESENLEKCFEIQICRDQETGEITILNPEVAEERREVERPLSEFLETEEKKDSFTEEELQGIYERLLTSNKVQKKQL